MVAGTAVAVGSVVKFGAAAEAGVGVGVTAGLGSGYSGKDSVIGGAVVGSMSVGAIAGVCATKTLAGAGAGALAGASSALGVSSSIVAGAGLLAAPFLCIVLGAEENSESITYDCWKQVVHNTSKERSKGILLKDLFGQPEISSVRITADSHAEDDLPDIVVTNVWGETFHIDYLRIYQTNEIVCHARPIFA